MGARRYVIVVHGMGEQRKNASVLAVIDRFAEARRAQEKRSGTGVLSLGRATGQTGKGLRESSCRYPVAPSPQRPWLEFDGIPHAEAPPRDLGPFLAELSDSGENLRFVDVWWSDILAADYGEVGEAPEKWAASIVERLRRKHLAAKQPSESPPAWTFAVLEELQRLVKGMRLYTRFRAQELDDLVFARYLGDVQTYGEFAHCRGRAVARFHGLLERVERAHAAEFVAEHHREPTNRERPRYTVIAHSLGSIFAFDALLYAHADPEMLRTQARGGPNLPFPGYGRASTRWIGRVDNFVTLGSPIDKFLFLWWQNYRYLLDTKPWMRPILRRYRQQFPIRHYNYCEEQDPVGHNLDLARSAPAYREVFRTVEDRVYTRASLPFVSHIAYWNDLDLFRRILYCAVDGDEHRNHEPRAEPHPAWFAPRVYHRILVYAYKFVPAVVAIALGFGIAGTVTAKSWYATIAAGVALVPLVIAGRAAITLLVDWRQISRWKLTDNLPARDEEGTRFRVHLVWLTLFLGALSGLCFGAVLTVDGGRLLDAAGRVGVLVLFGLVARAIAAYVVERDVEDAAVTLHSERSWGWWKGLFVAVGSGALAVLVAGAALFAVSFWSLRPRMRAEFAEHWGLLFQLFLLAFAGAVVLNYVHWIMRTAKDRLQAWESSPLRALLAAARRLAPRALLTTVRLSYLAREIAPSQRAGASFEDYTGESGFEENPTQMA